LFVSLAPKTPELACPSSDLLLCVDNVTESGSIQGLQVKLESLNNQQHKYPYKYKVIMDGIFDAISDLYLV
jgi:hypothetical protein